ncbi:hypothetical protein RclHR1_09470004 [Rhizophagus clarus]|uniref:TLDc domain-containing protein n=1 Tax=Rhizophagus clarus TaxID=94130 RepID=A0A2Z6SAK3_9GLOM|nr:hypothetical protein RclHR1_09470004 [Rhizophagus clarus]
MYRSQYLRQTLATKKTSKDNVIAHINLPKYHQIILKGSRDGYTPKVFHELCDETSHTVTFIKIKGKDEIIGGYNPLIWKSSAGFNRYKKTKESFIFSFKNNNAKDGIIINIEDTDRALWYNPSAGPFFVQDIIVYADNSLNYDDVRYEQHYCEKKNERRRSIWYRKF